MSFNRVSFIEKYNRYLIAKDYSGAFNLCTDVLQQCKSEANGSIAGSIAEIYFLRGEIKQKLGNHDRAIEDFLRSQEIAVKQRLTGDERHWYWYNYFHLAQDYFNQEQYEFAIAVFSLCLKLYNKDDQSYFYRGVAYYEQKRFDEAVHDFSTVMKIRYSAFYFHYRGKAYVAQGKINLAMQDFNELLQYCSYYKEVHEDVISLLCSKADFSSVSKNLIFEMIIKLPDVHQIPLLKKCLLKDMGDPLGDRMWQTEFPWRGCSLETGTLFKVCVRLKKLIPGFVVSVPVSTSATTINPEPLFDDPRYSYELDPLQHSVRDRVSTAPGVTPVPVSPLTDPIPQVVFTAPPIVITLDDPVSPPAQPSVVQFSVIPNVTRVLASRNDGDYPSVLEDSAISHRLEKLIF